MGILDILQQYANPSAAPTDSVHEHFDQVAQQVSPQQLGGAVAAAFRSDATPPFGQMIGNLFNQSTPEQRAGILNQLSQVLGSGALASIAGGTLANAIGGGAGSAAPATITPAQASQLSPSQVSAIAEHAQKADPSILDRAGEFYAQHPQLVKGLGAAALAIALGKLHSSQS
jgi:uncharacterized protein (DUF697 family)